jgi:putative ABC transport system permease protein
MKKYLLHFRQAWNIIRQEKLFSFIYIAGTGLSITMVMALSIVFYIKIAAIYPETNRDRLMYLVRGVERSKDEKNRSISSALFSKATVDACFASLDHVEAVGIEAIAFEVRDNYIQPDGTKEQLPVAVKHVDEHFWTIFPFRFVAGKPFTGADVQSNICTAVITESLARRLYGTTDAEGRTLSLDFRPFRVCGVVKDVSALAEQTYAQLWTPYTLIPPFSFGQENILGNLKLFLLAESRSAMKHIRQEVAENVRRYNQTLQTAEIDVLGQPYSQWQNAIFEQGNAETPNFNLLVLRYALILFILLLIPAVSLSGMTHSRMERRMAEMGIRRAFGARVGGLMTQIMTENLLFTLLGGGVGLAASYALVALSRGWMMKLVGYSFTWLPIDTEVSLPPALLLNVPVLLIAAGICFVLNLMSSLLPAWANARREIIHSLNQKP